MSTERPLVKSAPPAAAAGHPKKLAGTSNLAAEQQRVVEILERLRTWLNSPTLSPSRIAELTGLSRSRVTMLGEQGLFELQRGEFVVTSVRRHFDHRLAILSAAAKPNPKSKSATAGRRQQAALPSGSHSQ